MPIQPIILAGGTGTRLWPLSRELYPKQLINLAGELSLLQTTLQRVGKLPGAKTPIIVVGEEHRFMTKAQVEALTDGRGDHHILLEPVGRNTAAAICGACAFVLMQGQAEDVLLILPADHVIKNESAFVDAVRQAVPLVEAGNIVTFGVIPHRPETGYGYIAEGKNGKVAHFVEKPDITTAEQYLTSGNYVWNSGMFALTAKTLMAEMEQHAPNISTCMTQAVAQGKALTTPFFRFDEEAMQQCPAISIDYALMEKTSKAMVVKADLGWSDIGSWQALWQEEEKDTHGNVLRGDVLVQDTHNCLIRAEHSLVAVVGMRDTLVVQTADAVLVAPLGRSQDVKNVVDTLKKNQRDEFHKHRTVFRPWGSYTILEAQERFQIKRLTVEPGSRLSLQTHRYRHEHWVVVSGKAKVINGKKTIILTEDESTYIPAGTIHRLENIGNGALELIEVQIGSYLGEDDIIRLTDEYGRVQMEEH